MAALRHGVKTVIIPADNEKDLEEIDQTVRSRLNFITVRNADSVLAAALDMSRCSCGEANQPKLEIPVPEPHGKQPTLRQ